MARRIENECAFCAEEMDGNESLLGKDWKTYCCEACRRMGEQLSEQESERLMSIAYVNPARLTLRRTHLSV